MMARPTEAPARVLVDARPHPNGPPADAAPPRVQRREAVVDLPAPYLGFQATIWVNFPSYLLNRAQDESLTADERRAALGAIVLAHNGWQDEAGTPYPPPSEPAFWDAIPNELGLMLITKVNEEVSRVPNSMVRASRAR